MALSFKYKRHGIIYNNPVDEKKKLANELKLTVSLAGHLDDFNKEGGYILVTIHRDGKTFKNEVKGMKNAEKYHELIKNQHSSYI